jgi:hypothetical protein
MISALEWVPAGVADPTPKKYEFSQAELDLIQMMEEHNMNDLDEVRAHLKKQEEEKEKKRDNQHQKETTKSKKNDKSKLEKSTDDDIANLPSDLRMDEYSSDEDDVGAVGRLLIEDDDRVDDMEDEDDDVSENEGHDAPKELNMKDMDDDSDRESDDDDDLADVPDTREYTPVDLEGLNALGLSQVGTNAPAYMGDDGDDDDDDGSDAEDVRIQPGDAIVVIAKTEEVSFSTA